MSRGTIALGDTLLHDSPRGKEREMPPCEARVYILAWYGCAAPENASVADIYYEYTARKGFILTSVFLTRTATVDVALWDDTRIVTCDSQLWAI